MSGQVQDGLLFDRAAAVTASWACSVTARRVEDVADALTRAARGAVVHWHGLGREQFEDDTRSALVVLASLRDDLAALARRIDAACEVAAVEQARRDAERDWRTTPLEGPLTHPVAVPR